MISFFAFIQPIRTRIFSCWEPLKRSLCFLSPRVRRVQCRSSHLDVLVFLTLKQHGRFYVGVGSTCPPDSLAAPPPKLADGYDVVSEVPKCFKIQIFSPGPCWGSLQRSHRPPWLMGRGLAAPSQEPHTRAPFGPRFYRS